MDLEELEVLEGLTVLEEEEVGTAVVTLRGEGLLLGLVAVEDDEREPVTVAFEEAEDLEASVVLDDLEAPD